MQSPSSMALKLLGQRFLKFLCESSGHGWMGHKSTFCCWSTGVNFLCIVFSLDATKTVLSSLRRECGRCWSRKYNAPGQIYVYRSESNALNLFPRKPWQIQRAQKNWMKEKILSYKTLFFNVVTTISYVYELEPVYRTRNHLQQWTWHTLSQIYDSIVARKIWPMQSIICRAHIHYLVSVNILQTLTFGAATVMKQEALLSEQPSYMVCVPH